MTGELRIGVGSFIAPYVRMAALIFMERYPNVRINAEFTKAYILNQSLRAHMLDLAFTMNMAYSHEGIETTPCIPFNVYAIMRDTHPLASLPKVSYEDILKHPIIMPDVGERAIETFQKKHSARPIQTQHQVYHQRPRRSPCFGGRNQVRHLHA